MTTEKMFNARDCEVLPLSVEKSDEFLELAHRAGALKNKIGPIAYGLFLEGKLLGVVQFGLPRTSKMKERYSLELYRLAFLPGIRVRGGASKLIKHFIKNSRPQATDFFTYQDTSGEATAVYEHAGMTLVSQAKKKQYLVAPGKTLETGSRKEVLGMAYATRYGPDRILGTKLGEVFREDGTRKSNKDIFIEELGWHIEETAGDRVYEWVDPNFTFYTYKITAADSDKYYYGVRRIRKANASAEDCLSDGYYGSGGKHKSNKFTNWLKVHKKYLQKEVISLHSKRAEAFAAEAELVSDKWKTDPLCLNSRAGGQMAPPQPRFIGLRNCPIHGETIHQGAICSKCNREKANTHGNCEIHGATLFRGGICATCIAESAMKMAVCPIHGRVLHQGRVCSSCNASKSVVIDDCPIHGTTKFKRGLCAKCIKASSYSEKNCPVHGLTRHTGDKCQLCIIRNSYSRENCPTHGETTFHGGKCVKCRPSPISMKNCLNHGEQKHRGNSCYKCIAEKRKMSIK